MFFKKRQQKMVNMPVRVEDPNGAASFYSLDQTDGQVEDIGYQNGAKITGALYTVKRGAVYIHPAAYQNEAFMKSLSQTLHNAGIKMELP